MAFVRETFPNIDNFHYWAALNTPDSPFRRGWILGFPHVHAWATDVLTMICYLTDCKGGQLEVGTDKQMLHSESLQPEPGLCAILTADQWHGVRPITEGERIAVIVTAFPQGSPST